MHQYEILERPTLTEAQLDQLFAASWPGHVSRAFAPVLAHSLTYCAALHRGQLVGFVNVAGDGGAHAFLLDGEVVRTPAWLGELVPQAASAAVARRVGLPLGEQLGRVDSDPGFTVRGFRRPAGAEEQMKFQNLLLLFGAAALERFGEGSLGRLFRALWAEDDVVDEGRAERLLAGALGPGGREWLRSRPEF